MSDIYNKQKTFERIVNFINQLPNAIDKSNTEELECVNEFITKMKNITENSNLYESLIQQFYTIYNKNVTLLYEKNFNWITETLEITLDSSIINISKIYLLNKDQYTRDLITNYFISIFLVIESNEQLRNKLKECKVDTSPNKYNASANASANASTNNDTIIENLFSSFMANIKVDSDNKDISSSLLPCLQQALGSKEVADNLTKLQTNIENGTFNTSSLLNVLPKMQSMMPQPK